MKLHDVKWLGCPVLGGNETHLETGMLLGLEISGTTVAPCSMLVQEVHGTTLSCKLRADGMDRGFPWVV